LQRQIEKLGARGFDIRPQFAEVGDDKVIGSSSWRNPDGSREERYMVLTIRDGKIADMQACASRRQARRFARRIVVTS
jgi:hypothetical protein